MPFAVPLAIAASPAPAYAQSSTDGGVYARSGGWTIMEYPQLKFCEIVSDENTAVRLEVAKGGAEIGYIRYRVVGENTGAPSPEISWEFDTRRFRGTLLSDTDYVVIGDERPVIAAFKSALGLTLKADGVVVFEMSLAGSAAALQVLDQCAARWPDSYVPVVPPLAPPVQRRTPSLPLQRELTPIDQDNWIKPEDLECDFHDCETGRVGVALLVNAQGDVDRCLVTASSGKYKLDEFACIIFSRRAKFEPAINHDGEPIRWRWNTAISFGPPPEATSSSDSE